MFKRKAMSAEPPYESSRGRSAALTLSDLHVELVMSCDSGVLQLDKNVVTSPTFKWCLQTMGLDCLTLMISSPEDAIQYDNSNQSISISGACCLWSDWGMSACTITLSSGNAEHTVMYANTSLRTQYSEFSLKLIPNSTLMSSDQKIDPLHLPKFILKDVSLHVHSTSASTLPNCCLLLASEPELLPEPWIISDQLGLKSTELALRLENSLNKSGVVIRTMQVNATIDIAGMDLGMVFDFPVGYFTSANICGLKFDRHARSGLGGVRVVDMAQGIAASNFIGPIPIKDLYPAAFLSMAGEFRLRYYYMQMDISTNTILQVEFDMTAPDLQICAGVCVEETSMGVRVYNPFATVNPSWAISIMGKCWHNMNTCLHNTATRHEEQSDSDAEAQAESGGSTLVDVGCVRNRTIENVTADTPWKFDIFYDDIHSCRKEWVP